MTQFVCGRCGKTAPLTTRASHCACGGLFSLDFTPPPFSLELVDRNEWSIFRYRKFMPLENDLWRGITLGEGMTATLPLDGKLWVKLDYAMPTLSFKDRGAADAGLALQDDRRRPGGAGFQRKRRKFGGGLLRPGRDRL